MSSFNFITNEIIRQGLSTPKAQRRFWSKVAKCSHGDQCEECCWEWKASRRNGYGQFVICIHGKSSNVCAHRVSYILSKDNIPFGLLVRHRCPGKENRRCVNPMHLEVGTQKQNIHDALVQGSFGLLTTETVKEIRHLYAKRVKIKDLASLFDVNVATISDVVNYKTYKYREGKRITPRKLRKKIVKKIKPKITFMFVPFPRKQHVS